MSGAPVTAEKRVRRPLTFLSLFSGIGGLDLGLDRVDAVCGGFPCQPFSHAGRGRGVADDRWMWPAFADVVRAAIVLALHPLDVRMACLSGVDQCHCGLIAEVAVDEILPLIERPMPVSEWYCEDCRRWSGTTCCPSCLRINPGDARWMSKQEIEAARNRVLRQRSRYA